MDLGEESSVISAAAGIVFHVLLALLFLFSSVANVLVLVIFYRKPALRSLSNRFVMSLLLFNLVATLVLLPLMVIDSLIDGQSYELSSSYDYAVCTAGQAVTTLVTTGSISAALVIAVDQYCAVMAPLHYHRRVTKVKAWLLLAGQWLLAAALSAFSLPDSAGKRFWKGCAVAAALPSSSINGSVVTDDDESLTPMMNETTTATTTDGPSRQQEQDIWTLLFVSSSVICYVVPLALLTWMYLRIYSAAHRNSQRTRRTSLTHSASELVVHCLGHHHHGHHGHHGHGQQQQQSPPSSISGSLVQVSQAGTATASNQQQQQMESPCSALPSRTPSLRSTSSQIVHNLRYRISNASLFLYREEARAARVSVFVLVLVVCCWMPYHVLLALSGWSAPITGHQAVVPAYAYRLGLVAVLLNALASPFLYAYRSRRIQREVRRLFGLPPKSKKRTGKAVGLHRELTNSSSGQYGHHKRRGGQPIGQKSLRSLSPRRQLLRKQVRQGVCVSEAVSSTFEEVIGSSASGTVTAVHLGSSDHHRFGRFFSRMTTRLMWRSKGSGVAVHQSGLDGHHQSTNTCPLLPSAVPAAAAVTGELLRQQAISAVTRSSFSSATSSNSTSSAESDVSL